MEEDMKIDETKPEKTPVELKIEEIKASQSIDQVTELILDDVAGPMKLDILEPFTNLEFLSLKNFGFRNLNGFPKFPNLKKLDLSFNKISGPVYLLCHSPELTHLNLSNNGFKTTLCLKQLKKLKNLQSLIFVNNEANKVPEYRRKVFYYLKNLKDLDGEDKTADDGEKPTAFDAPLTPLNGKRKAEKFLAASPQKKMKIPIAAKNPLMQLNELKPGLKYLVESVSGPSHNPQFVVTVEVNGIKFSGHGNSKQAAKHDAAQVALSSFVQFQNTSKVMMSFNRPRGGIDFTMDEDFATAQPERVRNGSNPEVKMEDSGNVANKAVMKILSEADKKNPVMLLNEIHPGLEYSVGETNSPTPTQRFHASVDVGGEAYEGTGPNKKQAKASAARAVLSHLYNVSYNATMMQTALSDTKSFNFPQPVADKIAKLLMNTYNDVMVGNAEQHAKWKIIAAIAMTKDADMQDVHIIGLGTGTKCINGEHISMVGGNLNDCHAEIISRRCFKDFLYTNLELYLEGEGEQSILTKRDGGGFCLKPDIKFHLYISTAPCGDARIFCPHEEESGDRHPNRNSRGVLRTKIESGEGTIPIRPGQSIQTWDGILPGQERLLTMSCSDKIAAWNVLGLQGALLSYFVEPIYLESVILGGLFHPDHLQRALFGRIENTLKDLPPMYKINKPRMCALTSPETRHVSKSPNFSVNWSAGLGCAEVVNATTGKTESNQVSRLAKRSFFQRFINIHDRLPHISTFENPRLGLYSAYKAAVRNYQAAKLSLFRAFAEAGLGSWVKKPMEQNEFELVF